MADDPVTTRKKNTEAIQALTKKIAESKRKSKEENINDPASLRSYFREQTIGRIDIKRMLPPAVQGALGVFSDIRGIMKAKKIKSSLSISEDLPEDSPTPESSRPSKPKGIETESNNSLLEKLVEFGETQIGLLEKLSSSTGFIWDTLQQDAFNREIQSLNDLENEREKSRISKDTKDAVEENAESTEESGGFLSGLLNFFQGGSFIKSLLGGLGLTTIAGSLGAIVAPILGIAAALALGGIIAYELYEIANGIQDLMQIQADTSKILEDQYKLSQRREDQSGFFIGSQGAGTTVEDFLVRGEQFNEGIQNRLTELESQDPNATYRYTDPVTLETKYGTASEIRQALTRERFQQGLENRDPEAISEAMESMNKLSTTTVGRNDEQINTAMETGLIDDPLHALLGDSAQKQAMSVLFESTLTPQEREIFREARTRKTADAARRAGAAITSPGMGGWLNATWDRFFGGSEYSEEEQRLLDAFENDDWAQKFDVFQAYKLLAEQPRVKEYLEERLGDGTQFDPGNIEHRKIINEVLEGDIKVGETVIQMKPSEDLPTFSDTVTASPPPSREVTLETDNTQASAAGTNVVNNRGGDSFNTTNVTFVPPADGPPSMFGNFNVVTA